MAYTQTFSFFFLKIDEHASEAWERGRNARKKKKDNFFFSPPPTPNLKMGNASLRCWRFVWREGKTRSETRANSAVVVAFASFSPLFFLPSAINACKALFNLTCYHPSGQGTSPAVRTRWWVIFGAVLSQQLGLGNSEKTLTRGWHKGGGPQDCLFSRKKRKNSSESGWTRIKNNCKNRGRRSYWLHFQRSLETEI